MIQSYKDLEVYKKSFKVAMDVFWLTKDFPKEEIYSLTSQITRSSRSISANITEGLAKRQYENVFKQHLVHALVQKQKTGCCLHKNVGISISQLLKNTVLK